MLTQQTTKMGMPVTIAIVDDNANKPLRQVRQAQGKLDIEEIFNFFQHIDDIFSTYKSTSEISQINAGKIKIAEASEEVQKILALCEETRKITNGFFDIHLQGILDPSGIVKGYAIHEAATILRKKGYKNFFVEIAGDVEVSGFSSVKTPTKWRVGIENPFNRQEIIKVISITDGGVATSGNYIRGKHIYNPIVKMEADAIASMTVVGPNAFEADRFATAAFAMGENGIAFIESLKGFEGYMVRKDKTAVFTKGLDKYVKVD